MTPTSIEWTDLRWNPTRGCRRVSPGCGGPAGEGGCYAERQGYRFSGPGLPYEGLVELGKHGPRWTGRGNLIVETLAQPLWWKKPARVFVDSMSDLFFEAFTNEEIASVFGVMAACPHLTFQVLTKRAERMHEWFTWISSQRCHGNTMAEICRSQAIDRVPGALLPDGSSPPGPHRALFGFDTRWPLPNVWLGVSVENQEYADRRIPLLLDTPAAVRFVSAEPLLGPVDIFGTFEEPGVGWHKRAVQHRTDYGTGTEWDVDLQLGIDWVIVGGESGPGSRPFHVEWARSLVHQCHAADAAVFVKQLGAHVRWNGTSAPGEHWRGGTRTEDDGRGGWRVHLNDRKGGDWNEWPEDLRVREFPTPEVSS